MASPKVEEQATIGFQTDIIQTATMKVNISLISPSTNTPSFVYIYRAVKNTGVWGFFLKTISLHTALAINVRIVCVFELWMYGLVA